MEPKRPKYKQSKGGSSAPTTVTYKEREWAALRKQSSPPLRTAPEDANPSCSPTIQRKSIILRVPIAMGVGGGLLASIQLSWMR